MKFKFIHKISVIQENLEQASSVALIDHTRVDR